MGVGSIDFALQAQSHGLVELPREFWDMSLASRHVAADLAAKSVLARPERHSQFIARYRHLLPQSRRCGVVSETSSGTIRPAGLDVPDRSPQVLLLYNPPRNETSIGLGVNAELSARALREIAVVADGLGLLESGALREVIENHPSARTVVIEGFWVAPEEIAILAADSPRVAFICRCHSQIAFLQIEPDTIVKMRAILKLSQTLPNVRLAGNSRRLTDWASSAWNGDMLYLPNLYHLRPIAPRPPRTRDVLRLASFGAMRLQKHHTTAAAAACLVSRRLGVAVEFFVNSGREEMGGTATLRSMQVMLHDVDGVSLVDVPWQPAPLFRRTISSMDLCFQLSSTETFNLVTADAAAAGVPSVVGECLDWTPCEWQVGIDDPNAAAEVALNLLADPSAGTNGRKALEAYCAAAIEEWRKVLSRPRD